MVDQERKKMETNKEFITRMYLLVNEIPKEKLEDYNNILSLLSFQLKMRDMDHINEFVRQLTNRFNSSHVNSTSKRMLYEKLKGLSEESRYTFSVPEDHIENLKQILGSKGDKKDTDNLKH